MVVGLENDRVSARAEKEIRRVLNARLKKIGFNKAEIRSGHDYDGDPVIFIEAYYKFRNEPVDVRDLSPLIDELVDALNAVGEPRFPHIRHHFDDRQEAVRTH
jgi:hypothetical protein